MSDAPASTSKRLIRWPTVHERTGKSRAQAWRDIKVGTFPAPVSTGPNSIAWLEHEVDLWIEARQRVRYAPQAA